MRIANYKNALEVVRKEPFGKGVEQLEDETRDYALADSFVSRRRA